MYWFLSFISGLILAIIMANVTPNRNIAARESRKVIAVIDTGFYSQDINKKYMCKTAHWSVPLYLPHFSKKGLIPVSTFNEHGPNVIGLIGNKIDSTKYCIKSFRVLKIVATTSYLAALKAVVKEKNLVGLNISMGGDAYFEEENEALKKLVKRGVKVNVAAGNDSRILTKKECTYYPACFKLRKAYQSNNFKVVGAVDTGSSNTSEDFEILYRKGLEQGTPVKTGTSQATANYTGEIFSK